MARSNERGPVRFRVVESEEGTLLGNLVARRLGDHSVRDGVDLVRAGAVYVGHLRVRVPTVRVVPGERITVYPEALQHQPLPSAAVKFVYRDPSFVVLDKPAGVPVTQTKQSARGTLSEALRRVLTQEGIARPYVGVVHRLDQHASGLVLFTIRGVANRSLHRQFVDHHIDRRYRVMVRGEPPKAWTCDAALLDKRGTTVQVAEHGESGSRTARTDFTRLSAASPPQAGQALVQASLHTGRTHQIRVHAAHSGFPIVGDLRYGDELPPSADAAGDRAEARLLLHAWRLDFDHPVSGERLEVMSTPPDWAAAAGDT